MDFKENEDECKICRDAIKLAILDQTGGKNFIEADVLAITLILKTR